MNGENIFREAVIFGRFLFLHCVGWRYRYDHWGRLWGLSGLCKGMYGRHQACVGRHEENGIERAAVSMGIVYDSFEVGEEWNEGS